LKNDPAVPNIPPNNLKSGLYEYRGHFLLIVELL
jgi:hypothetical protein